MTSTWAWRVQAVTTGDALLTPTRSLTNPPHSPSTHTMPSSTKTTDAAATAAADDDGCSKATMDSKAISAGTQPPLSFSRWFAFQSYTTDLLLLLLDLIVIAPPYVAQLWVNRQCFPLAGAPHATQQTLPLDTAAYRADSIISRFPCAASYTEQLAYTVATGAALDPWVRIRAGDWGNLLYVCMLILTLAIAFASPRLYVRCRWPLFAANAIAHLAGNAVAAVAVPVPMLALLGPSFYGSFRRRVGVLHTAWRSLVVLRVSPELNTPRCVSFPHVHRAPQGTGPHSTTRAPQSQIAAC